MKVLRRTLLLIVTLLLTAVGCGWGIGNARADVGEPALLIGQIKVTSSNGQFITLYNNSSETIDMSSVELAYYNNYDLLKSTSNKFITLSGKLAPGNYYLVSDGPLFICYKMTVNAISLGFSTTAGMVQVIKMTQSTPGGLISSTLIDSVAWSKTSANGIQLLPSATTDFLQRIWANGTAKVAGGGSWQTVHPDATNQCDLQTQLAASITPPAATPTSNTPAVRTVASVAEANQPTPLAANIGLVAPEITELFPNPKTPQSDDADEFIELYNPNDSTFSLKGYRIEVGTSYARGYTFTEGNLLPKSYTAFSITQTNAQLSNTEGQVRFLNTEGATISETPSYEDAPEGSSWGIIDDSWQWLVTPSPNAVNIPNKKSGTLTASSATAKKSATKLAGSSTSSGSSNGQSTPTQVNDAAPLHPLVLAGVGIAAVAYAIYEYRKDFANRIFQIRRYLRNRRTIRARV